MAGGNFHSGDYGHRLLELISNQLQMANLQRYNTKHVESQVEKLRMKIMDQRAELGIAVDEI